MIALRDRISSTRLVLALAVCVAAYLRFYDLGVPSLWSDEMWAVFNARHPLPYLFSLAWNLDVHPPYYHAFVKGLQFFGSSDFVLRLPSALAGAAAVPILYYFVSRTISAPAGLAAAALLAVNELHVWLSRTVRPYAIMVSCFLVSFFLLLRYAESGKRKHLYGLLGANLVLALFHYTAIYILCIECVILLLFFFRKKTVLSFQRVVAFCLFNFLLLLPILPFLANAVLRRKDEIYVAASFLDISRGILVNYEYLFTFVSANGGFLLLTIGISAAVNLLMLAGLRRVHSLEMPVFTACLSVLALSFLLFCFASQGAMLSPWHLSYLLIPSLLLAGAGLTALIRKPPFLNAVLALVLLTGAAYLLSAQRNLLYVEDNELKIYNLGSFKTMAGAIGDIVAPGEHALFTDRYPANALDWYLERDGGRNPVREARISPEDEALNYWIVSVGPSFAHLANNQDELSNRFGKPEETEKFGIVLFQKRRMARKPDARIDATPFSTVFTASPEDFYGGAHAADALTIYPYFDSRLIPTRYGAPGWVEYRLINETGDYPQFISVAADYLITGVDNSLAIKYAFDGEPFLTAKAVRGPAGEDAAGIEILRTEPYRELTLRFELTCVPKTAAYPGGNHETVGLKRVGVYVCSARDKALCDYEKWLAHSPQRFLDASSVRQSVSGGGGGLSSFQESPSGWERLEPVGGASGSLAARLVNPGRDLIFYPRLSGAQSEVRVIALENGGEREIFAARGVKDTWTPVGMQFRIPADLLGTAPELSLEIRLSGPSSQLWIKQGAVFF